MTTPYTRLVMLRRTLDDLPEISPPDGYSVRCFREGDETHWNRIIQSAFSRENDFDKDIRSNPDFSPNMVWFVCDAAGVPVATAAINKTDLFRADTGLIFLVGCQAKHRGKGLGFQVVLAAMHELKRQNKKAAALATDDYRLAAVKTYLKLGFIPYYTDLTHYKRWFDVLRACGKKLDGEWEDAIKLWNDEFELNGIPLWDKNPPLYDENCSRLPAVIPYIAENSSASVIVCAGGAYGGQAYHEGRPVCEWLRSNGISAFLLNYRVSPCRFPEPLLDVQRAIRFVRHNAAMWGIKSQKVGVLGFSAGGHLVSMAATLFDYGLADGDEIDRESSRPDACVLCYPVISLTTKYHIGSAENLLGKGAGRDERRRLSSEYNVKNDTPPCFIWHTSSDNVVPVENSLMFAKALAAKNIPFELHIFPFGEHGLGLASRYPLVEGWPSLCIKWLKENGF